MEDSCADSKESRFSHSNMVEDATQEDKSNGDKGANSVAQED